jgi:cell division protein FtsW (lipid II flippase)
MRNKKISLIIKAVLIALLSVSFFLQPNISNARKWIRFAMLIFFVVTFIIDYTKYKKENG